MKNLKYFLFLLILIIAGSLPAKKIFLKHSQLLVFSNLYNNGGSAYSLLDGYRVMDMVPLELSNLAKIKGHFLSITPNFVNGGAKLGYYRSEGNIVPAYSSMDYLDGVANLFYTYRKKYNFFPFVAYSTPFKQVFDNAFKEEIKLKQDKITLGAFSPVRENFALLAVDYNLSTYEVDNGIDDVYHEIRGGFSFRGQLNVQMNKYQSFFIAASTPTYWSHDYTDDVEEERVYFSNWVYNGGLNYQYTKNLELGYRFTYREFHEYIDTDGDKVLYPWTIEHGVKLKYQIRSFYKLFMTYDLIPSAFYLPKVMREFKHQLGGGIYFKHEQFSWNLRVSDSTLFSKDIVGTLSFSLDLNYEL